MSHEELMRELHRLLGLIYDEDDKHKEVVK